MKYTAHIRRNADGEVRQYHADQPDEYLDSLEFSWSENNFACDCNRHLFFERAVTPDYDEQFPCGERAYRVLKIELADGTTIEPDHDRA